MSAQQLAALLRLHGRADELNSLVESKKRLTFEERQAVEGIQELCMRAARALEEQQSPTFMGEPVLPTRWAAVQLQRDTAGMCVVSLRVGGGWVPVIRDNGDVISHVCEPSGIAAAVNAATGARP